MRILIAVVNSPHTQVGAAALLIASKYEDVEAVSPDDLASSCSGAYTLEQLLAMETLVLQKLDFRLGAPTAHTFAGCLLEAVASDCAKDKVIRGLRVWKESSLPKSMCFCSSSSA